MKYLEPKIPPDCTTDNDQMDCEGLVYPGLLVQFTEINEFDFHIELGKM